MAQFTGACVYCGQTQLVVGGETMTEEEINKQASLQCNCDEAQFLQKVEQKKTYAAANIKRLFENDGQAALQVMLNAVEPLACQKIKKLSLVTGEGIRATLTAKENSIKVERVEIEKSALED